MKAKTSLLAALALSAAFLTTAPGSAAEKKNAAALPFSSAFGQNFDEWLRDYWAWDWGGNIGSPTQPNGVSFLQLPTKPEWAVSKDGKLIGTAEMSVTIKPGTKLVLGAPSWIGEVYIDGHEDIPWPSTEFLPLKGEALITLDETVLVNADNMADFYYGPVRFKEPILYADMTDPPPSNPGAVGAVWVQGIGIVLQPLTPGEHTLVLYWWDSWKEQNGAQGYGWFNTWHITVEPPGK